MRSNIFTKNGKQYFNASKNNWHNYLNHVSKDRKVNKNIFLCGLKEKNSSWCYSCNKGSSFWSNTCVNVISLINLQKHSNIIFQKNEDTKFYEIEIDVNNRDKTN